MEPIKVDKNSGVLYRQWEASSPNAIFLLVHGLGAHSLRWQFLSVFFLRHNFSSYAIELKGFGETKDTRGHIDSFDTYFNDIRSLRYIIHKENYGKKIFLVGESMGALISFLLEIRDSRLFDGLICISPAFQGRMKLPLSQYVKILLSSWHNSKKEIPVPFTSEMCTRDSDYQKIMDSDSREYRMATLKLLRNIALAQVQSKMLKDRIKTPVLFLVPGEDKLVIPQVSEKVFRDLKVQDKEIVRYPEMYHALSVELGKEKVFTDILNWVKKRI
tara:strand:+ start:176 stop:994 length:819 start_codon:yes stop_codon:yes gene_type:complete